MSLNRSMLSLMTDEVTIEPFESETGGRVQTFGQGVTYRAQVLPWSERVIGANGRELRSTTQVIIPDRLSIDVRSRITLPAGFVPLQPPIMAVQPMKGLGLDHTRILL